MQYWKSLLSAEGSREKRQKLVHENHSKGRKLEAHKLARARLPNRKQLQASQSIRRLIILTQDF